MCTAADELHLYLAEPSFVGPWLPLKSLLLTVEVTVGSCIYRGSKAANETGDPARFPMRFSSFAPRSLLGYKDRRPKVAIDPPKELSGSAHLRSTLIKSGN